jgi:hypothetical protein
LPTHTIKGSKQFFFFFFFNFVTFPKHGLIFQFYDVASLRGISKYI